MASNVVLLVLVVVVVIRLSQHENFSISHAIVIKLQIDDDIHNFLHRAECLS